METKTQSVTLPEHDTSNAYSYDGKKELVHRLVLVVATAAIPDGEKVIREIAQAVDARWWMSRTADGAGPVYCSVWVRTRDGRHLGGRGVARGYGYCKQSAAFDAALDSAGITLAKRVDGVGMEAVEEAMHAIADAAGYSSFRVRSIV